MNKEAGNAFDPLEIMKTGCMNVICSLVMGREYKHGDEGLSKLMKMMDDFILLMFKNTDGDVITALRMRPGHRRSMAQFKEISGKLVHFIRSLIEEKEDEYLQDNFDEDDADAPKSQNFIQAYMREWKKVMRGETNNKTISENWLYTYILDMILTGSQSVPTVMSWFILYMMKFPDIQKKVQKVN